MSTLPMKPKAPTIFGKKMRRHVGIFGFEKFTVLVAGFDIRFLEQSRRKFSVEIDGLLWPGLRKSADGAARFVERSLTKRRDALCKLTGTVAVETVMPGVADMCPTDSKELSKLRAAIDDACLFPSEAASFRGDYVAAVRSAGRRLEAHQKARKADKKTTKRRVNR